jgi:hypothetical protein
MNKIYIFLDDIRLEIYWSWPEKESLKIVSVKDDNGNKVEISDFDRQIIYEEIIDSID